MLVQKQHAADFARPAHRWVMITVEVCLQKSAVADGVHSCPVHREVRKQTSLIEEAIDPQARHAVE